MANFAQIKQGQMVIDPFVGTSLLIPPSHYKALSFGCDLDVRVLRGYSVGDTRKSEEDKTPQKKGNIFSNFDDYKFPRSQIIRQDINKPPFRKKFLFDVIICDSPWLINFAIDNLKIRGFLVCLFPVRKERKEEDLDNHPINFPMHPQFKLIQACENINSKLCSRWYLTYKNILKKLKIYIFYKNYEN